MHNIYLCVFADTRMLPTKKRLEKQVSEFGEFKDCFFYNEHDFDDEFLGKFSKYLIKGSRGFGYWVWKPYVILKSLQKLCDDDILIYLDAGCHINKNGKLKFYEYINTLQSDELGLIVQESSNFVERMWSKGDLLDYFSVRNDLSIIDIPQREASIILMRKNKFVISFVAKWLSVFEENFSLVDDTPSVSSNLSGFVENRHDQSVFSILTKKNDKIKIISENEYYSTNWDSMYIYPFLCKRDKVLSLRYRYSLKRFLKKCCYKLLLIGD